MPSSIRTSRLELVVGTPEIARADADDRVRLSKLLDAEVPAEWPPELLSDHVEQFAQTLEASPHEVGWWSWYVVRDEPAAGPRRLIGSIGFGGPPKEDGSVITGYSLLEAHFNRGYATEALAGLLGFARASGRVRRVIADTFPPLVGSIRVLEKNGFAPAGDGDEPGAIRFELPIEPSASA